MKHSRRFLFPICCALAVATGIHLLWTVAGVSTAQENDRITRQNDYLSPDLRRKVEALKREVAAEPTTLETARERSRVVWEWANAFALGGRVLPVDLPATIARLAGPSPPRRGAMAALDGYTRELALHDDVPGALGEVTTNTNGPFPPGAFVTIEQTYRFGKMPMKPRGGVLVARHFMSNQGRYQATDPAGENYITIKSSNPRARFVPATRPVSGMHGGFRGAAPGLFFRLQQGTLREGDTVTVTYGDRRGGSPGFRVQTYSNDAFPLPLYLDLEGSRELLTLPMQSYEVGGGPVHAVHAFAPSVVKTGEAVTVSVRSEDVHYNRAVGEIPSYRVFLNGELFRTLPGGTDAISLLEDIRFDTPGVYRLTIQSTDGRIRGAANPIWVREDPGQRLYWGDTHGHCGFAEGQGTPDAFFEFGRDDARLDFLTLSEHDLWMDDAEWKTLLDKVEKYNEDGRFVTIPGYEWTVSSRWGGHHNVFFRDTKNRNRVPNQSAPVLTQLYRQLAFENDMRDVLIIPHAHQPGDYRVSDPNMEHLVEIMSMHGHFEWFGRMYLKHGHEVGFVAASDDHLSHPGYSTPLPGGLAARGGLSAVWAEEKTRDGIFDAMKALSAYATTGQRIIIETDVNGAPMGTRTDQKKSRRISGRVIGTAAIDQITIVKNGEEIWSRELLTATDAQAGASGTYELSFHSTTDPGIMDSPRGWRPWRGSLRVRGAKLKQITSPSLQNRLTERLVWEEETPDRAEFTLITRGASKNLLLELEDVGPEATVEIELSPSRERPSTPARLREAERLPRARIQFDLADTLRGRVSEEQPVGQFTDTVSLRRILPDAPLEHAFEFVDVKNTRIGDYYFVRVKQLDGGMAWASPVWVGGTSPAFERELPHPHQH